MPRKPNILLIMTDQHRADLMSCAGNSLVPTPNLDRLASRGVRFENAYCPYPACLASRSALLTGLYAHTTGAINNQDLLDWRYRTVAHHFAEHGYLTALIGKMHFNDVHSHGFAYYLSINDWLMYLGPKARLYAEEVANHPLGPKFFNTIVDDGAGFPDVAGLWGEKSPWVGDVTRFNFKSMASRMEEKDHLDAFVARESAAFLRRYQDQPFFLVASFMKPHTPLFAPEPWAGLYPVEDTVLPPVGDLSQYPDHIREAVAYYQSQGVPAMKAHRAGYLANLAYADVCVGRLLNALEQTGLAENTIVVYTSDHGEMNGDHGLFQKFCLFDPSVKAPLMVSFPGRLPEGRISTALVDLIGLYPTLSDLAGLPRPENTTIVPFEKAPAALDAESFATLCENPDALGPEAVFSEYNLKGNPRSFMVRTRKHKVILNAGNRDELYDLEIDPNENVNLAENPGQSQTLADLRQKLIRWYDFESMEVSTALDVKPALKERSE